MTDYRFLRAGDMSEHRQGEPSRLGIAIGIGKSSKYQVVDLTTEQALEVISTLANAVRVSLRTKQ